MKINSTDYTYCTVTDIDVTGLTAKLSLLMYSSSPQVTKDKNNNVSRAFCFYLKDLDTGELTKLSNNTYWVDRSNRYLDTSNNIDINMYKKIILNIDISNRNTSNMLNNRWIRRCDLLLYDALNGSFTTIIDGKETDIWVYPKLTLISDEIVLPKLSSLKVSKSKENKLTLSIDSTYDSQEDFNYINNNLKVYFTVRSIYTNLVLENKEYISSEIQRDITTTWSITFDRTYDEPILLEVRVTNLKGDTLLYENKYINPEHTLSNMYIKTNSGVKSVVSATVKISNGLKQVESLAIKR